MDPLTLLFRLPFLPIKGVVQLGEIIQEQVEREQHDPASVRRQLEEIGEAHVSGEISDPDLVQAEEEAVGRLIRPTRAGNPQNGERS